MIETKQQSIFQLTWPIFVELILTTLVGNVDQYMLSCYSQNAVAAIGNANQILNVLILIFNVINLSTTILASQYLGSFREDKTMTVYNLALLMNFVFSIAVSLTIVLLGRKIFMFMQIPAELMDDALTYLDLVGGFIFLLGLYTAFSAIFKTRQMVMYTMNISILINVIHLFGNLVLINGLGFIPALGVKGAAISTVTSRFMGLILCVFFLYRATDIRFKKKYITPFPMNELKKMLGIGLPSAGENMSYSLSQTFILRIVNMFGVCVINAKVFVNTFQWISVLLTVAISQVAQILVGRAVGARNFKEVDNRIKRTLFSSVISGVILATIVYIFSDNLVGLFTNNQETIQLAKKIFFIDIFLQIGRCSNVCLVRCLQATGDTKFPVMIGIIVMWVVALGFSYILGVYAGLGLVGVWIAMAMDENIRAIIFFIRWKSGVWKKFSLI